MKRGLKDALKRTMFRAYRLGTRLGVHVLPVHYYSALPDVVELARTRSEWARRSTLPGLAVDLDEQVAALRETCLPYREEYAGNAAYLAGSAGGWGPGYGYIEAQALHAVIRRFAPARIIEVGSGVSTCCMLAAVERNRAEGRTGSAMTCVEPYPSETLRRTPSIRLVADKVQRQPVELFRELDRGDLLFIDSSHTVRAGGDVNYLVLEVLPSLRPGVIVHFHDIYLPYDYQRNVLATFLHWSETSLVRAYLACNERARILFSLSMLHYDRQSDLREVFPEYRPAADVDGLEDGVAPFARPDGHFPSSLYLETR